MYVPNSTPHMATRILFLARVYRQERRLMVHFLRAEKAAVMVHSHPGDDWQALRPFSLLHNVRGVDRTLVVV